MATKKPIKKPVYSIILQVSGLEYKGAGETFKDAILSINPTKFVTRGNLITKKDGKKTELMININQLRKLFGVAGSTTQEILISLFNNRVDMLLK